jgi:hypothetical protein
MICKSPNVADTTFLTLQSYPQGHEKLRNKSLCCATHLLYVPNTTPAMSIYVTNAMAKREKNKLI